MNNGLSKVKVTEVQKLCKWPFSKSVSSCNQKSSGELWCSKTVPKFWRVRLLIFILIRRYLTFKLSIRHTFSKEFCLSRGVDQQSNSIVFHTWTQLMPNCRLQCVFGEYRVPITHTATFTLKKMWRKLWSLLGCVESASCLSLTHPVSHKWSYVP